MKKHILSHNKFKDKVKQAEKEIRLKRVGVKVNKPKRKPGKKSVNITKAQFALRRKLKTADKDAYQYKNAQAFESYLKHFNINIPPGLANLSRRELIKHLADKGEFDGYYRKARGEGVKKTYNSYKHYLDSPAWRAIRKERFEWDQYKCVHCGNKASQVHHKKYPGRLGTEMIYDLESVCKQCHAVIHDKYDKHEPEIWETL
jgi:hypothetical protein